MSSRIDEIRDRHEADEKHRVTIPCSQWHADRGELLRHIAGLDKQLAAANQRAQQSAQSERHKSAILAGVRGYLQDAHEHLYMIGGVLAGHGLADLDDGPCDYPDAVARVCRERDNARAELERCKAALLDISRIDHTRAATNCAAATAVQIATGALDSPTPDQQGELPEGYQIKKIATKPPYWQADTVPRLPSPSLIDSDGQESHYESESTQHPSEQAAIAACWAHKRRQDHPHPAPADKPGNLTAREVCGDDAVMRIGGPGCGCKHPAPADKPDADTGPNGPTPKPIPPDGWRIVGDEPAVPRDGEWYLPAGGGVDENDITGPPRQLNMRKHRDSPFVEHRLKRWIVERIPTEPKPAQVSSGLRNWIDYAIMQWREESNECAARSDHDSAADLRRTSDGLQRHRGDDAQPTPPDARQVRAAALREAADAFAVKWEEHFDKLDRQAGQCDLVGINVHAQRVASCAFAEHELRAMADAAEKEPQQKGNDDG